VTIFKLILFHGQLTMFTFQSPFISQRIKECYCCIISKTLTLIARDDWLQHKTSNIHYLYMHYNIYISVSKSNKNGPIELKYVCLFNKCTFIFNNS